MAVVSPKGIHKPLRCNYCRNFSLRARAKKLIGLCPCCQGCTPDQAALPSKLHYSTRERHGGLLFWFQWMFEGSIKHVDRGF